MWKLKQFIPKETVGLEGRAMDIGKIKVQIRKAIAEGGFSCVYLAVDALQPSKQYALKHMMCNDEESMDLVRKEIGVMKILKGHPNIVTLVASDVFDMGRNTEAFVLMEFCDKSLVSVLENRGSGYYDEKQILLIFRDICNAVFAMHCQSPPIAHRDLKAENLLLGSDGAWKLCDFGSTSTNHKCFDKPGEMGIEEDNIRKHTTPAYRSPEMWDLYRREVISEKVDIWALGCLLYRICYFKSAFDGESKLQVLNGNYHIPELPKYSSSTTDLIKDMLQGSPDSRPDITQVWFRVNLLLPVQLQKETPDGPLSTAIPNMQMPTVNAHCEGSTKRTAVIPSMTPTSKSEHARKNSPQYVNEEQKHRVSMGSSKASGDGAPLGMFWATHHEESISQTTPKQSQQSYVKRGSPPREKHPQKPLGKTNWGNSLNKSDGPREDFEIRFDSDSGSGKTRGSHVENLKIRSSFSEKTSTFENEAFNTFVAEFDTTKLSTADTNNSKSGKELSVEVERLKEQVKQSNLEKVEITSKYEKLSSICRSQRQEIHELKQKVAKARQSSPNNDSMRHQSTAVSLPPSSQQREKIEGSVLELQQEMFANVPISPNPDQNSWQPFADEPKPQPNTKGNRPKSVRTTSNRRGSGPSSTGDSTNGTWGFGKESFTAALSPQGSNSHRCISSDVKKTEAASTKHATSTKPLTATKPASSTKPAGWAGF